MMLVRQTRKETHHAHITTHPAICANVSHTGSPCGGTPSFAAVFAITPSARPPSRCGRGTGLSTACPVACSCVPRARAPGDTSRDGAPPGRRTSWDAADFFRLYPVGEQPEGAAGRRLRPRAVAAARPARAVQPPGHGGPRRAPGRRGRRRGCCWARRRRPRWRGRETSRLRLSPPPCCCRCCGTRRPP